MNFNFDFNNPKLPTHRVEFHRGDWSVSSPAIFHDDTQAIHEAQKAIPENDWANRLEVYRYPAKGELQLIHRQNF